MSSELGYAKFLVNMELVTPPPAVLDDVGIFASHCSRTDRDRTDARSSNITFGLGSGNAFQVCT